MRSFKVPVRCSLLSVTPVRSSQISKGEMDCCAQRSNV